MVGYASQARLTHPTNPAPRPGNCVTPTAICPLPSSRPPQGLADGELEALTEALLADHFEVHPAGEEGVDDLGVPLDAGPFAEDLVDLRRGEPASVGAGARHGVVRVGDGEDAGL